MPQMSMFRPITEDDIKRVIEKAGGGPAVTEPIKEGQKNADCVLGNAIIEIKILTKEGLRSTERHGRIAEIFDKYRNNRPVCVIDPSILSESDRRAYIKVIQSGVKRVVQKSSKQLKQTRLNATGSETNILFIVNDGMQSLTHDDMIDYAEHRIKEDTGEIDAVIVATMPIHGDGFEAFVIPTLEMKKINNDKDFPEFDLLRQHWYNFVDRYLTEYIMGMHQPFATKEPHSDIQFEFNGITYVRPAPIIGMKSDFYGTRVRAFELSMILKKAFTFMLSPT